MTDWIEHNGGPQPVADNVWVEVNSNFGVSLGLAEWFPLSWEKHGRYRILNQHLIDAARLEGIRLGLEAADKVVSEVTISFRSAPSVAALRLMKHVQIDCVAGIRNLNPETIAKETQHD